MLRRGFKTLDELKEAEADERRKKITEVKRDIELKSAKRLSLNDPIDLSDLSFDLLNPSDPF